ALAILIAAAFNMSPTPSAAKPHPVRTAMQKAFISSPDAASGVNESNYASYAAEPAIKPVVVKTITVVKQTGNAVKDASAKASDASASVKENVSSAAAMSKTDMDRIEKEALEVIHGDYGNNPGRAAKLGADYALVQARVNQLLHS
ncbi:MAG: hypothetical protein K2K76_05185, partial [Muribaculaceae bacterium]|nr:hypothetical protein [Muribaculaceae bacterium]